MHMKHYANGVVQAVAWPAKRGPTKDPAQIIRNQNYGMAQKYSADPMPIDLIMAYKQTQGTPFLPRDFLVKAAYGTLVETKTRDGIQYRSLRLAQSEITTLLDSISNVQGTILYRGTTKWLGLAPDTSGKVLTTQGVGHSPIWAPPPGGGGGGGERVTQVPPFDPTATAGAGGGNAFVARCFAPTSAVTINGVRSWLRSYAGANVGAGLYQATASGALTGATLVAQGALQAPVFDQFLSLPFPEPITLDPGNIYWLGINFADAGNFTTATFDTTPGRYFYTSGPDLPATPTTSTGYVGSNFAAWGY